MNKLYVKYCTMAFICGLVFSAHSAPEAAGVSGSFVYKLSDFAGPIPYNWARLFIDKSRNETYVLYGNYVRIFDKNGMEIFRFGEDLALGAIVDADIDTDGNILLLAYDEDRNYFLHRLNYRGELVLRITLTGLPKEFAGFSPSRVVYRQGNLYLASLMSMKVVVIDSEGLFKNGYDLANLLKLDEKERVDNMIVGFSVDNGGNILCTIPTLFRAFVIAPDGKVMSFGEPGGMPGKFGVVAGIIADDKGNYLVVDKLKCMVMIYDRGFNFLNAFGFRGDKPGNLIAPDSIAMDAESKIYVTQSRRSGVNVYRLNYE